jgi:hypothetical protein
MKRRLSSIQIANYEHLKQLAEKHVWLTKHLVRSTKRLVWSTENFVSVNEAFGVGAHCMRPRVRATLCYFSAEHMSEVLRSRGTLCR